MIGESNLHFISWVEMGNLKRKLHRCCYNLGERVYRKWHVSPDVKYLIPRFRHVYRTGNDWSYVADVRKGALLLAISEYSHRFTAQQLIHENPDNIPITIANVLSLAVNVMGAEDNVWKTKHFVRHFEVAFYRELRDAVGIFLNGSHVFCHG